MIVALRKEPLAGPFGKSSTQTNVCMSAGMSDLKGLVSPYAPSIFLSHWFRGVQHPEYYVESEVETAIQALNHALPLGDHGLPCKVLSPRCKRHPRHTTFLDMVKAMCCSLALGACLLSCFKASSNRSLCKQRF